MSTDTKFIPGCPPAFAVPFRVPLGLNRKLLLSEFDALASLVRARIDEIAGGGERFADDLTGFVLVNLSRIWAPECNLAPLDLCYRIAGSPPASAPADFIAAGCPGLQIDERGWLRICEGLVFADEEIADRYAAHLNVWAAEYVAAERQRLSQRRYDEPNSKSFFTDELHDQMQPIFDALSAQGDRVFVPAVDQDLSGRALQLMGYASDLLEYALVPPGRLGGFLVSERCSWIQGVVNALSPRRAR